MCLYLSYACSSYTSFCSFLLTFNSEPKGNHSLTSKPQTAAALEPQVYEAYNLFIWLLLLNMFLRSPMLLYMLIVHYLSLFDDIPLFK